MELPEGWEKVNLLKYLQLVNSGVKSFSGNKKYIATGSLETDIITNYIEVDYNSKPSRANMEVIENDILCAKMKDTEKLFIISKEEEQYLFSTGFAIFRVIENQFVFPKYIYYWMRSPYFQVKKNRECTGATQKAINEKNFKKFSITLPPPPCPEEDRRHPRQSRPHQTPP